MGLFWKKTWSFLLATLLAFLPVVLIFWLGYGWLDGGAPSDARWDFALFLVPILAAVSLPVFILGWMIAMVLLYKLFAIPETKFIRGVEFVLVIFLLLLGSTVIAWLIWVFQDAIGTTQIVMVAVGFLLPWVLFPFWYRSFRRRRRD